jgi:hypothetical protein
MSLRSAVALRAALFAQMRIASLSRVVKNTAGGQFKTYGLLAAVLGLFLIAGSGMAQVKSSTVTGIVTDASGAVVPNATVLVTNEQTNVALPSKSNGAGEYTVPYLEAGQYSLTVTATGFQTSRKTGIVMGTATTVRVDVALVTGTVATTVEVKANAAALQTENATVQGAVTTNIIESIPNINKNPIYYASLQAGVVPDSQSLSKSTLGVGFTDRRDLSAIRINGAELGTSDVQLDGVSIQGSGWHEMTVMPDPDALQEVRVTTNNFTAETGDAQGVIAMATKSGTNQFHGDLNYFLRNEALDANGMTNNLEGIKRPVYRLNQGGGSIGGPVIIPHVYNGKDKLFFFVDFMRLAHSEPDNVLTTVPTDLQRAGNFSQTMVAGTSGQPVPVNLYNPFTAVPLSGNSTVVQRSIYPGAVITNPSQYGVALLKAYPEPNATPTDPFGDNNYRFTGTIPEYRNALVTRVDYKLNAKNSLYATGGISFGSITQPNQWGNSQFISMNWGGNTNDKNPYASIGDTYIVSPTMVIDVRYGLTHINTQSSIPDTTGFNYTQWGMPANVQPLIAVGGTSMEVSNFGGPIANLNMDMWDRKHEHQLNHDITGSVTKMAGRWTFKAGGEFRVYLSNWRDLVDATPYLSQGRSANASTAQYANLNGGSSSLVTNPANAGIPFADLLTGVGGYTLVPGCGLIPAIAAKYAALFSQNDWKVTNRLTINLGLRWEVQPGPTERHNNVSDFDPNQPNPYAAGVSLSNPLGGMGIVAFPGVNGQIRNMWNTQWDNFSPRVGVAYQLTSNTVLRGGYGRSYVPSNTGFNANGLIYGTLPFAGGAEAIPYGLSPNGVPIGTFDQPGNTLVTGGEGAVQSPYIYGNGEGSLSVDLFPQNYPNSRVDQWNFFVERTLGHAGKVSVGYVGSRGSDLAWRNFQLNGTWAIPNSTLQSYRAAWIASNGAADPAQTPIANPLPALIGMAQGTIGNATIPAIDAQMPYLALLGQTIMGSAGITNYNALQVTIQHAYSNGLTLLGSYVWSKSTGLTGGPYSSNYVESQASGGAATGGIGGIDYANLNNNRGLQSYDIPQRLVATVSYRLPFDKGQKFAPGNKFAQMLASGWRVASVVTLQSGEPWGPNCGGMDGRCDIVPNEPMYVPKNLQHFYDGHTSVTLPDGRVITPAAFSYLLYNPDRYAAPVVQFPNGTSSVDQYWYGQTAMYPNGLRTPGLANVNLSIQREISIRERLRLLFAAEATNAFNRTNFLPSAMNGGGGAVTQADSATHTAVGMNSSISTGSLNPGFYDPRQITLSLYLRF